MKLTEEQKGIIELVKQGKTNAYIAKKTFLSVRTIERRLQNLYEQFGAENRAALVVQIIRYENRGYCDY